MMQKLPYYMVYPMPFVYDDERIEERDMEYICLLYTSSTGVIKKVAGPLVIASGMRDANMFDVVRVSKQRLIGEIIEIHGDEASIQVYEETSGLEMCIRDRLSRTAAYKS